MERIEIVLRSLKTEGEIRLRFRLWDGRKIQLYHKSDIMAPIAALSKFTPSGQVKPRVTVNDHDLHESITKEMDAMREAYKALLQRGVTITNESFNSEVYAVLNLETRSNKKKEGVDYSVLAQLRDYALKASKEGVIGESRLEKYTILKNTKNT